MASYILASCGKPDFKEEFSRFAFNLCKELNSCFKRKRNLKLENEAMWGCFHRLRSSTTFKDTWISFVQQEMGKIPSPIFYQEVIQHIFKVLVKRKFIIMNPMKFNSGNPPLTREEENSLRYMAGYIYRRVRKQLESLTHKCKDDMILCLMELNGDEDDEERGTEDWTNALDRGGLWHVSDTAYNLFYAIEEVVRQHLVVTAANTFTEGTREVILSAVMCSEDVLFQWCLLTADADDANGKDLLQMIVKLYITIRGFSFASSCVELFKKANKTTLQKGKGIRKELFTSKPKEH